MKINTAKNIVGGGEEKAKKEKDVFNTLIFTLRF